MSELAKKFMEHSGTDEFGNLVLLFEDRKIKMAFGEDGEPLLMCKDVGRACGFKGDVHAGRIRSMCRQATHKSLGCRVTSWHFTIDAAMSFLGASRIGGANRLWEFLVHSLGVVTRHKNLGRRREPAQGVPEQDGVEFRNVPGASLYCVGNDGSIWSGKTGKWSKLKTGLDKDGYYSVVVRSDVKEVGTFKFQHKLPVHRLILLAFKGEPFPKQMACHNNGDKLDNRPENLRWGTAKDNAEDTVKHGRVLRGEDSPNAVLDNNTVIAIRELRKRNYSPSEIARLLWLPEGAVKCAAYGRTWKHVV